MVYIESRAAPPGGLMFVNVLFEYTMIVNSVRNSPTPAAGCQGRFAASPRRKH